MTTVCYDPCRGTFRVTSVARGSRSPRVSNIPLDVLERIGDMDITELSRRAMMFPGREHQLGGRNHAVLV